ncbi:hypothetical protein MMC28_010318 [Mycoblastus sanguinarius]|nr:hypothetical protein [Mycoblastus sanguinarius]
MYRKFGWLHNRALLDIQDELSELEHELQYLDEYDFKDGDEVRLISRRYDYGLLGTEKHSDRRNLINQIKEKLKEYDPSPEASYGTSAAQSIQFDQKYRQRSSNRSLTGSVTRLTWLLSLGTEHGWFNDFLEDLMNGISRRMAGVSVSDY